MTVQVPALAKQGATAEIAPFQKYEQRLFAPLGLWKKDNWSIKAYGIHHDVNRTAENVLDKGIAEAAREHVFARLPEADAEGSHHHCGFAIVHQGLGTNWIVFNWWAYENVCCEALGQSSTANAFEFKVYGGAAMACIWEMVVIEFERRAWIEHMLRADSNLSAYLESRLPPGRY